MQAFYRLCGPAFDPYPRVWQAGSSLGPGHRQRLSAACLAKPRRRAAAAFRDATMTAVPRSVLRAIHRSPASLVAVTSTARPGETIYNRPEN